MAKRNSTVKIENGKVVLSQEIIDYFENLRNEENSEWIDKYFNVLGDENNLSATKYREHHIIPCFMFKDENHKSRKETLPLANNIEGNLIKLSVSNHILAHHCLWKIFNNEDSRRAIYLMSIKKNLNYLSEDELKRFAEIQEECAKENMTDEEKRELCRKWRKENKEREKEWREQYNELNKERISENKKKYRREHEKERKEWEENHKEERKAYKRNYNREHKDELSKMKKEKYIENRDEILANNHLECKDPIKGDKCTLVALKARKNRHKEDYKNINPKDCIIKSE